MDLRRKEREAREMAKKLEDLQRESTPSENRWLCSGVVWRNRGHRKTRRCRRKIRCSLRLMSMGGRSPTCDVDWSRLKKEVEALKLEATTTASTRATFAFSVVFDLYSHVITGVYNISKKSFCTPPAKVTALGFDPPYHHVSSCSNPSAGIRTKVDPSRSF